MMKKRIFGRVIFKKKVFLKTIFKNYSSLGIEWWTWSSRSSLSIIIAGQKRGKDFALEQLFSLNGFSLLTFDLPLSAYNSCPRWTCPKFHRSRRLIWIHFHFHLALFQKRIVQPWLDESDGDFCDRCKAESFFRRGPQRGEIVSIDCSIIVQGRINEFF